MKKIIIILSLFMIIIICFFGNVAWSLFISTKEIKNAFKEFHSTFKTVKEVFNY